MLFWTKELSSQSKCSYVILLKNSAKRANVPLLFWTGQKNSAQRASIPMLFWTKELSSQSKCSYVIPAKELSKESKCSPVILDKRTQQREQETQCYFGLKSIAQREFASLQLWTKELSSERANLSMLFLTKELSSESQYSHVTLESGLKNTGNVPSLDVYYHLVVVQLTAYVC
jgi:hypothetical protein